MQVAEAVGRAVVAAGVDHVFGVVGSGNFHLTNAMVAAGARFVAARHEGGAATMADAYARNSGTVAAVSVHQGCGLTNAMTGITEAAKSRTPVVVLAAEVTNPASNFFVDQGALAEAVGAVVVRVDSAAEAVEEVVRAVHLARDHRRTVLINLPLDVQAETVPEFELPAPASQLTPAQPSSDDLTALVAALQGAQRPVFVAGRGGRSAPAREALLDLAVDCGALLATSAVAKGLFRDDPWSLDVSGGFASPLAAELISGADLIVGWGCALNMWTMRHGALIAPDATVVQVDDTAAAIGAQRSLSFGVLGDVEQTAVATRAALANSSRAQGNPVGYRTSEVRRRIDADIAWRDVPFTDLSSEGRIDPRTFTLAIDEVLPTERVVAVDSGNFMGYPSMFLSVPDERGFCFTQSFQSIGLGLATAIGAALTQPGRVPVAALGDGGAMMGASEFDTVRRLGLPMVVLVYNDDAYGAEVHHFGPDDHPLDTVVFPETDIAALARGYGFEAMTVRNLEDLEPFRRWLAGPRDRPVLIDAKVVTDHPAWWLEEAFRGH